MQITDLLQKMGALQSMARELGVSESQAASGSAALIPAILGGFKKQAQSSGTSGLGDELARLGGGGLMDNVLGAQPTNVSLGNDVLGHIFGSKEVSRTVAQNAATQTGLDPTLLKKMLPMLAMLVGGFMSKQGGTEPPQSGAAGLARMLGNMLGGAKSATGGPGLASLLDLDGDGNPLDDIIGMLGKR